MLRCVLPPFSASEQRADFKLDELDARIRRAKSKMDPYFRKNSFKRSTSIFSPFRTLPSMVEELTGDKHVDSSWIKAYELIHQSKVIEELVKLDTIRDNNEITQYDVYGVSGSFIHAVEYYLKKYHGPESKQPLEHTWLTHTYGDIYKENFDDQGLPRLYLPGKVDAVAKHDMAYSADEKRKVPLLSVNNGPGWKEDVQYVHYSTDLPECLGYVLNDVERNGYALRNCYLFTGDLNIDFETDPHDFPLHMEQELVYSRHLMAQVTYAITRLSPHGCMILKMFSFFSPFVISILALLSKIFKRLELVKPASAKADNSEIFIVGYDYTIEKSMEELIKTFWKTSEQILKDTSYDKIIEMTKEEQKNVCNFMSTTIYDISHASAEWTEALREIAATFVTAQEKAINLNMVQFDSFEKWERDNRRNSRGPNFDGYVAANLAKEHDDVLAKWCKDNDFPIVKKPRKNMPMPLPAKAKSKPEQRPMSAEGSPITKILGGSNKKYDWGRPRNRSEDSFDSFSTSPSPSPSSAASPVSAYRSLSASASPAVQTRSLAGRKSTDTNLPDELTMKLRMLTKKY